MPDINVKKYNDLVAKLEKIADRLQLHGAAPTFPAVLKEEEFRGGKQDLEDKRQPYDQAVSQARQAYNAYNDTYLTLKAKVANGSTHHALRSLRQEKSRVSRLWPGAV